MRRVRTRCRPSARSLRRRSRPVPTRSPGRTIRPASAPSCRPRRPRPSVRTSCRAGRRGGRRTSTRAPRCAASAICAASTSSCARRASGPRSVVSSVGAPTRVALHHLGEHVDEPVPDVSVHVHPLGRAARLPGVVERAFGDVDRHPFDVDVVADVRGVLAAELQLHADELVGRGPCRPAGRCRATR